MVSKVGLRVWLAQPLTMPTGFRVIASFYSTGQNSSGRTGRRLSADVIRLEQAGSATGVYPVGAPSPPVAAALLALDLVATGRTCPATGMSPVAFSAVASGVKVPSSSRPARSAGLCPGMMLSSRGDAQDPVDLPYNVLSPPATGRLRRATIAELVRAWESRRGRPPWPTRRARPLRRAAGPRRCLLPRT